jgi:hypothetical protein
MKNPPTQPSAPSVHSRISPFGTARVAPEGMHRPAYDLNLQCLELLVKAAWAEAPDPPLVRQFQGPLRSLSQDAQARIAQQSFLLVDMHLTRPDWWDSALKSQVRARSTLRPAFSRASAVQLGRATITLLHHSTHVFGLEACLLGAHPSVLKLIITLSLSEIDRVAERNYSDVRPRWENRPAFWQKLFQSGASTDVRKKRDLYLTGLQLLGNEIA